MTEDRALDDRREISFVVPCYNEAPEVLAKTLDVLTVTMDGVEGLDYEIIVVNDGSTKHAYGGTCAKAVRLVNHTRNMGYGASLKTGIKLARHNWIGIVDADETYPIEEFPALIREMGESDMVVGKRDRKGVQLMRRPAKKLLTWTGEFIAGERIPDLNSGMRLFKKEVFQDYARVFPDGFSFTSTLTMVCMTTPFEVKFVDISYFKRKGQSKIHPVKDTARFFTLIFRLALYFRPLRFFIPLSSLIVLLAVARGLRDMVVTDHFGGLTLVLFFMAFQVFFFGLLAEFINKK